MAHQNPQWNPICRAGRILVCRRSPNAVIMVHKNAKHGELVTPYQTRSTIRLNRYKMPIVPMASG